MKRGQFIRKLRKYCRKSGKKFRWEPGEGDGSHGTVYVDDVKTTVKDADFPNWYIGDMLEQLNLDRDAV